VSHDGGAAVPETSGVFFLKIFLAQNVRLLFLFTDPQLFFKIQAYNGLDLELKLRKNFKGR